MKKNKNGFTLVEVIIAMAVFAVMALLVCTLYAFLNRMVYKSNSINTNVDSQVANYEKGDDINDSSDETIIFTGDYHSATTDIEYKVIEDTSSDPNSNPDIKYFCYKP